VAKDAGVFLLTLDEYQRLPAVFIDGMEIYSTVKRQIIESQKGKK